MARTWDIFCSVVDNYGDIGVCWRLARQLAAEHPQTVRLWLDDLASLHPLCHAADPARDAQHVAGVDIRRWDRGQAAIWPQVEAADIVVEGFGVRLPEPYIAAMANREWAPVWINLEYLSAEGWVESHHGLPSPQADGCLVKYFFFPGFAQNTGGLIVERGLVVARDKFQRDTAAVAAFRRRIGLGGMEPDSDCLWLSLFCYENTALQPLLDAWSAGNRRVICVIPEGRALEQVSAILGRKLEPGAAVELAGALRIAAIPFLEQDDYDRLLWSCDVNFVRGEDSFVRAQLAARPLIWQAYPQEGDVHLAKVAAFVERYAENAGPEPRAAFADMTATWNGQSAQPGRAWSAFCEELPALARHAESWAAQVTQGANLAERLANFCENKLK